MSIIYIFVLKKIISLNGNDFDLTEFEFIQGGENPTVKLTFNDGKD
jgi:hypothetical protein